MSAMATSLMGPRLTARAFAAAPPPRPPQPTRIIWIRSLPAACTAGIATPAKAETAADLPLVLMNSRRLVEPCEEFMAIQFLRDLWLPLPVWQQASLVRGSVLYPSCHALITWRGHSWLPLLDSSRRLLSIRRCSRIFYLISY